MNKAVAGSQHNTVRRDPIAELSQSIVNAGSSYPRWNSISTFPVWEGFRLPSKLLYDFVQKCPAKFEGVTHDVRGEMLKKYFDHVTVGLTAENINERERRFMTYLQAASFAGVDAYLAAKTLTILAYRLANRPLTANVRERITTCERFHRGRNAFTEDAFTKAGYEARVNGRTKVFVHPESRDSMTFIAPPPVLTDEQKAHAKLVADAKQRANQAERLSKQPAKGSGSKGAEGGGTSKKSKAKEHKRSKK
jgi:hypothetical protein